MNPLLNLLDLMRQTDARVMTQIQTLNQSMPAMAPPASHHRDPGGIPCHPADLLDTLGRQHLEGALETLSRLDAVSWPMADHQRKADTAQESSIIDIQAIEMPGANHG